jgi:hypothetical protein
MNFTTPGGWAMNNGWAMSGQATCVQVGDEYTNSPITHFHCPSINFEIQPSFADIEGSSNSIRDARNRAKYFVRAACFSR